MQYYHPLGPVSATGAAASTFSMQPATSAVASASSGNAAAGPTNFGKPRSRRLTAAQISDLDPSGALKPQDLLKAAIDRYGPHSFSLHALAQRVDATTADEHAAGAYALTKLKPELMAKVREQLAQKPGERYADWLVRLARSKYQPQVLQAAFGHAFSKVWRLRNALWHFGDPLAQSVVSRPHSADRVPGVWDTALRHYPCSATTLMQLIGCKSGTAEFYLSLMRAAFAAANEAKAAGHRNAEIPSQAMQPSSGSDGTQRDSLNIGSLNQLHFDPKRMDNLLDISDTLSTESPESLSAESDDNRFDPDNYKSPPPLSPLLLNWRGGRNDEDLPSSPLLLHNSAP